MKKKIIIGIIIAVALLAVVAACLLLIPKKDDAQIIDELGAAENVSHLALLRCNTKAEVEAYLADTYLMLQTSDDPLLVAVGHVPVKKQHIDLFYQLEESGNIVRLDGLADVALESKDVTALKQLIQEVCACARDLFSAPEALEYKIYSAEGYELPADRDASLEKVLNGNAVLGMNGIEGDGAYWNMTACLDGDTVKFEFFHDYNVGAYTDEDCNILSGGSGGVGE